MEQDEKKLCINLNAPQEKPIEVIYRTGFAPKAPEPLETKAPEKISVKGVISTPLDWLKKRVETFDHKKANIQVDREAMTITLTICEDNFYTKNTITGKVDFSDVYKQFGINDTQKGWEPAKLGQFLRLNRGLFENKEQNMTLVSLLKNFSAKCKGEIQKQRDPSGSVAEVYRQEVESNLPKSFVVSLPIFKGTAKQSIEVEFDHYLMDSNVYLQLVSPGANEVAESYRDSIIDSVIGEIEAIAPDIPVLYL